MDQPLKTIHNPYDQAFKDLADYDIRGMMHITGRLRIDAEATVTKVPSEIRGPAKLADHVGIVRTHEGTRLDETEAVWDWQDEEEAAIVERIGTLAQVPPLKVHTEITLTIVLLNEAGAPTDRKQELMVRRGKYRSIIEPYWVELYNSPAELAFEVNSPEALAMIPLMRHTDQDLVEAKRRLERMGNEGALAQFLHLVDKRHGNYAKTDLRRRLGMFERVTMEAAKSTEFARMLWEGERRQAVEQGRQEGLEQGLEQGLEKGREEGLAQGLQSRDQEREEGRQRILRVIRRTLSRKFPDLADHPALELVPLDRLEDLHDGVLAADNVATTEAAILDASRPA
jgi:hypothetical protein